jgi:hypothetical protein
MPHASDEGALNMGTNSVQTRYGILRGVFLMEHYPDGALKECTIREESRLETPYGLLAPQYEDDGVRRKFTRSLSFYNSGALNSISLQQATPFRTAYGSLPAELVTFYESGHLKRIFPLNGKLSGFWSEENEYKLAPQLTLKLPFGEVSCKLILLYFYESDYVKSVTLWPGERMAVPTPVGVIDARTGVSFYNSGAVRSLEPFKPVQIETPIGPLIAFDNEAQGICGDRNSLCFDEEGGIAALKTSQNAIEVTTSDGFIQKYSPRLEISHFSDDLYSIEPLNITFSQDAVSFGGIGSYRISACRFNVSAFDPQGVKTGDGCPGCGECSL